jgi:predicted acetyltransferase
MADVRPLDGEDLDDFIDILADAYPGWKLNSPEDKERVRQRLLDRQEGEPPVAFYGLFEEGRLLGGMRLHDFRMNFLGARIPAGGVGLVAVHFLHKKEHVAKHLMTFFLRHYREQGALVALLYPFRPDFYRRMGFGYSTKVNEYHVPPAALPRGPSRAHVRYLGPDDREWLFDCYSRFVDRQHGMIERSIDEIDHLLKSSQLRVVGYEREGILHGYMFFTFEQGENFLLNDLRVRELVYENRESLAELLTFLHTQADQIRHVIFDTQDPAFHHLLLDPRSPSRELIPSVYHESNTQGVGLMIRVIDVAGIFTALRARNFGGQTCRLALVVEDSFLPENAARLSLHVQDGVLLPAAGGGEEVEVRMAIAEFSSLLAGTIDFRRLYEYGLADISNEEDVDRVTRLFRVEEKPICMTAF